MSSLILYLLVLTNLIQLNLSVPPFQFEEPPRYRPEIREDGIITSSKRTGYAGVQNYRLPSNLVPISYNLRILPILNADSPAGEQYTAPGSVTIKVNCVQTAYAVVLHSYLLNITESSIKITHVASGVMLPIENTSYNNETHFYSIALNKAYPLQQGQIYEVYMEFVAPISLNRNNGLYRGSYKIPGIEEPSYFAVTQFESWHARQMFPCFDEPQLKAIYNVIIGRNVSYTSLTNSKSYKIENHDSLPGWVWESYEPSVPMPSYTFAIAVAIVDFVESDKYRLPVKVYGPSHQIKDGVFDYAVNATAHIMKYFDEHFQVDYPMSKIDSFSVPGKRGAMENYALVKYGTFLALTRGEVTEGQRKGLDTVISHELAHQWFGNLVTCAYWNNAWLNEGFATFASYLGVERYSPEYFPKKDILNRVVQFAMRVDTGSTSRPINPNESDINTLEEIDSMFDSITYDKGAALVRMMTGFLGEATFNKGLRRYLKRRSHMAAVQDDLFYELNEAAKEDGILPEDKSVKMIMNSWTHQKGFPLVRVTRANPNRILLTQEHFKTSKEKRNQQNNTVDSEVKSLWEIPIAYATAEDPNFQSYAPKLWLGKNETWTSFNYDTSKWIMINPEGIGFYRVLYALPLLSLIEEQLNKDYTVIRPLSRSQLLDDYFTLAFQEYISIETVLPLTKYLGSETDFTIWQTVFTNMRTTFALLSSTPAYESLQNYFAPRIGGALKLVGVRQDRAEKGAIVILRSQLLDWACVLENSNCIAYANDLYNEWRERPSRNPYPIDIQGIMYCTSVANGGAKVFEFFLDQYKNSKSDGDKTRIVGVLSCAKEEALLMRLLKLSIDETSGFSKADSAIAMSKVGSNSLGRRMAFEFIRDSLQDIISYHSNNTAPIALVVATLSSYYSTSDEASDLTKYIEANNDTLGEIKPSLLRSLNAVHGNILWRSKFYEPMNKWFEANRA